MVSARNRATRMTPTPANAAWSQKITRQLLYVTMTPPMSGPNAGPISVLEECQYSYDFWNSLGLTRSKTSRGRLIVRSTNVRCVVIISRAPLTGLYMSPMQPAPTIKSEVPWKAVRIRNMKNDSRFGASAVPIEKARNKAREIKQG